MPPTVDIHTHVYPPAYMAMLRSRRTVPYVHDPAPNKDGDTTPRLIILASDDDPSIPIDQRGRPVDSSYSDINVKLSFMRRHGITTSVISLANPWLDFLEPADAQPWAERINNDLEATCAQSNATTDTSSSDSSTKPLYAFGALPLTAPSPSAIVSEIHRLKTLPHLRGVIMGTSGLGKGLDDPALDPIWSALQETNTLVFLHPHYGLPEEAYGANGAAAIARSGHVMPLALGFPLETTIAVTRMLLAGAFDRFPKLTLLLAHSGGTLPFLAGRIESCIHHERKYVGPDGSVVDGPRRSVWDVLKTNIYLDAVVYGAPGLKAAVGASGADRLMFGTDHPFFPPLDEKDPDPEWPSVTTNYDAIKEAFGDDKTADAVLGGNAVRVLDLK